MSSRNLIVTEKRKAIRSSPYFFSVSGKSMAFFIFFSANNESQSCYFVVSRTLTPTAFLKRVPFVQAENLLCLSSYLSYYHSMNSFIITVYVIEVTAPLSET